jgi:glycosyltransferase involved in cell wall biosynthesis
VNRGEGAPRPGPSLAVVIPAFRAAAALPGVLELVRRQVPGARVIVVDDGSDDGTAQSAQAAGASVLRHLENRGKGCALSTGLAAAVEAGAETVVTLDADGQHAPEALPLLLEPLVAGTADLVVGARARDAGGMPPGRRLTNWLSSALLSRAVGFAVPDSQSGFRAMRRQVAADVGPGGGRYEYETEFLFRAARRGFRISAVSVPTVYQGAHSHFRYGADTLALAAVYLRHWRSILLGPEPTPR